MGVLTLELVYPLIFSLFNAVYVSSIQQCSSGKNALIVY